MPTAFQIFKKQGTVNAQPVVVTEMIIPNAAMIAPCTRSMTDHYKKDENQSSLSEQRVGYMTTLGWDKLLAQVNAQIEEMEQLPLPDVKDKVFELLAGIDSIHRESLGRLVSLFKEGVLEQVVTDPAIHTLMELYDLLPEVVDDEPDSPPQNKGVQKIPIYEIPSYQPPPPPQPSQYPHWVPIRQDLSVGVVKELEVDGHWIVLCRVRDDEIFALSSRCAQDGTSLATSTLNHYTLTCASHSGCHYDVRQGTRVGTAGKIDCYPVKREDDGRVLVGIDMDFVPQLPTF